MLVKFGIKNSKGIENISAIDISKASKFAYELDSCCPGTWRLAGVVIDSTLSEEAKRLYNEREGEFI